MVEILPNDIMLVSCQPFLYSIDYDNFNYYEHDWYRIIAEDIIVSMMTMLISIAS